MDKKFCDACGQEILLQSYKISIGNEGMFGKKMVNATLCPSCTEKVRLYLRSLKTVV